MPNSRPESLYLNLLTPNFQVYQHYTDEVVSGTWKYDEPRVHCPTNDCVSYVLSYGQLQES